MDEECAVSIEWEGLKVEATRPPGMTDEMFANTVGMVGNEMLRLNAALVAMGDIPIRTSDGTSDEL